MPTSGAAGCRLPDTTVEGPAPLTIACPAQLRSGRPPRDPRHPGQGRGAGPLRAPGPRALPRDARPANIAGAADPGERGRSRWCGLGLGVAIGLAALALVDGAAYAQTGPEMQ